MDFDYFISHLTISLNFTLKKRENATVSCAYYYPTDWLFFIVECVNSLV